MIEKSNFFSINLRLFLFLGVTLFFCIPCLNAQGPARSGFVMPRAVLPTYGIYFIFALLGGLVTALFWWLTARSQRKRTSDLESIVEERTADLQRVTQEALEARAKAEEASRAKSAFLANMSHEIRTPLNGVIGITDLLGFTQLTDQQQEYVKTIRISGENLMRIINEILDFSKIEAGKMELSTASFNLRDCVEEVLDIFSTQCAEKGVNLAYRVAASVPEVISGDQYKLRQVLINLLGNAMKFTEEGEVFLSIALPQPKMDLHDKQEIDLAFSVKDTGIGMSKKQQDRLFESFSQADRSIEGKFGGTGLGLMISKTLVEMMGGTIDVKSQLSIGTNFNFNIKVGLPETPEPPTPPVHAHLKDLNVLIVEDGIWSRMALVRQFQDWGLRPFPADSPQEAMEILESEATVHLVVTDMVLEETSGEELARWIKRNPKFQSIPILLLSSIADMAKVKDKQDLFSAAVSKPVKYANLLQEITQLLKAKKTGKQDQPEPATESAKDALLGEKIPMNILIAEDNEINQMLALRMFNKLGYQPDMVENGAKAVKFVQENQYDLLFMDVQMPEIDGLEATRKLRSATSDKPLPTIIAMTANALEGDKKMCLEAGMDDYLSKPFRISDLIEIIQKYANEERE